MTITRVQGNFRTTMLNVSSVGLSLGTAPVAGNILILCIGAHQAGAWSPLSVTQTGVVWSQLVQSMSGNNSSEIWMGIVGSGASASLTISGALMSYGVADICEYSGFISPTLDKSATSSNYGTTVPSGTTGMTTSPSELWIGSYLALNSSDGGVAMNSIDSGFTLLDGAAFNTTMSFGMGERIVSTIGAASATTNMPTSNSRFCWGCIATIKNPTIGGSPSGNAYFGGGPAMF